MTQMHTPLKGEGRPFVYKKAAAKNRKPLKPLGIRGLEVMVPETESTQWLQVACLLACAWVVDFFYSQIYSLFRLLPPFQSIFAVF
jgi:hypothetical protein